MFDLNNLHQPYLIADIGINHNADMAIVRKLIDAANACSWDCVKFQKRSPDHCVPEKQKNVAKDTPWGRMTYLEYKHKLEFGSEEYDYIDKYCKEKPISWTASVWDLASLEFLIQYEVPFIKIPSAKIINLDLLKAAALTRKHIILSTGMSTLEEIDVAVDLLKKYSTGFALMHTNSSYPAKNEELNLNCIKTLQQRYQCPIGYSGHEYALDPTVYAAVLGVKIIERHITLDHSMWGTDQKASLEPTGMYLLRNRIKDVEQILGNGLKCITESETIMKDKLRG
jgi:N-acetylneuraminate synthase